MPRLSPAARSQRAREAYLAAPIGGLDTISAGSDMPPSRCVLLYNMVAAEYGLRTRLGWREWCTGLGTPAEQVRSLLSFTGSTSANSRLFACTTTGIWDVTSSSAAPTQVVTFPVANTDSGWGISTVVVTAAGHFLLYCDEENGLYSYTESTATWTKYVRNDSSPGTGEIGGVDPASFVHVMVWKNRVWFVEADSGRAWFLPAGTISGTAQVHQFGNRFQAGGDLRLLASWTFGGNSTLDDALVAVSGGGDVLVYKGTDPTLVAGTFSLSGVWSVGAVPAGRRFATNFGGDLLIMSSLGIVPMSVLDKGTIDASLYATSAIANLFNQLQSTTASLRGWTMRIHPQDMTLICLVPVNAGQPSDQLVMGLTTKSWSRYRDLPIGVCAEAYDGAFYFGTEDGRVCINDGTLDGITLADPASYEPIAWSLLTAFQNLGDPRNKQVQLIRPKVMAQGASPLVSASAMYAWNIDEAAVPVALPAAGTNTWDNALWDSGTWAGVYAGASPLFGAAGCGPEVAIAVRGSAVTRTILTGIDLAYTVGGFM